MSLLEQLEQEKITALSELESTHTEADLEAWRLAHLGKSAPVMQAFSALGSASKEERPLIGKTANAVKVALESAFAAKNEAIRQLALATAVEKERLDVTLPGRALRRGRLHPLNQTLREICRVFGDMGFQVYRSPEVETDDYNFTFLNMPPYHPARDMWDTFYTEKEGVLLRTHTSPGQIHIMRERAPEAIRAILPGTTMRYEQLTARSEIEFVQVEVLVVGKGISLQGTVTEAEKLIIEGTMESQLLQAQELVISHSGVFKGEVQVEDAEIAGTFDGTLTATGSLTIRATGRVIGTARSRRLSVEDGGQLSGKMEMITETSAARVAPAPRSAEPAEA